MSKGLPRSRSRGAPAQSPIVRQLVKLTNVALQVDGATGVGFGSAVVADLPEGNILFLGAVAYLQFTTAAAGVTTAFDGDYAVGTVATVDVDVSDSGEADLISSTALGAATGKVSPVARGTNATQTVLDNTDGSLEINLNLLVDDANISADDVDFTVSGTIQLSYIVLGDD